MAGKKKRSKLIDKSFQLKVTFKVIGITSIFFLVIIAVIAINSNVKIAKSYSTITGLSKTKNDLKGAIETQDDIIKGFLKYSQIQERRSGNSKIFLGIDKISKDHSKSMKSIKSHMSLLDIFLKNLKEFFSDLRVYLGILIAVVLLQAVFLFFYMVNLTHRISGPIYVISQHIRDLMEGKDPNLRSLRKNDELQEFYNSFVSLAEKIKEDSGNK